MTRQVSGVALTAKMIRKELKSVFPGVKFSVRSSQFSMGNSVDISWTDGPARELVDHYVKKYQSGYFDGMTDCYEYVGVDAALGCDGAKYVQTSRTMSAALRAKITDAAASHGWDVEDSRFNPEFFEENHPELWDESYRAMKAEIDEQRRMEAEKEEAERRAQEEQAKKIISIQPYLNAAKKEKEAQAEKEAIHALFRTAMQGMAADEICDIVDALRRDDWEEAYRLVMMKITMMLLDKSLQRRHG